MEEERRGRLPRPKKENNRSQRRSLRGAHVRAQRKPSAPPNFFVLHWHVGTKCQSALNQRGARQCCLCKHRPKVPADTRAASNSTRVYRRVTRVILSDVAFTEVRLHPRKRQGASLRNRIIFLVQVNAGGRRACARKGACATCHVYWYEHHTSSVNTTKRTGRWEGFARCGAVSIHTKQ